MSTVAATGPAVGAQRSRLELGRYLRRNPSLVLGGSMVLLLLLFTLVDAIA